MTQGSGKVAVITGASGGLASAIARRLSADSWHLVLMSRSGCGPLADEFGQAGIAGSVLEDTDVEEAVALARDRYGRLDSAIFSGGRQGDLLRDFEILAPPPATPDSFTFDPGYNRELFDIPFEAWQRNYDMNVLAPMRLFRAALPAFREAGGGSFVAMSGIEALQPRLPYPLGPNRLALHGFVRLLADRYGRDGIRVNCIAPGLMENAAAEFPEGWVGHVPAGRYGKTAEIFGSVAYLLSEDAGYVTGQTMCVDGGVNRKEGL